MARPDKQGIDYFPLDCDLDMDDKLSMIIGEYGSKGENFYTKLLCWIYKHDGYYVKWEEDVQLRFLRRYDYCGFSVSFINEVVPRFIKWELFNQDVFNAFHILTSIRIQETWLEASRKRIHRKYIPEIWLTSIPSDLKAEQTIKTPEETPQSKLNESKRKETKVNRANALVGTNADVSAGLQVEYKKLTESVTGKSVPEIWIAIRDFIVTNKPGFIDPYVDAWNVFSRTCKLTKVDAITDSRKKKFNTRVQEDAFDFLKILEKIKSSDHLKGNNNGNWKVTFDWVFENDKNYVKIIEGNYN
jgi:hypothetical protein